MEIAARFQQVIDPSAKYRDIVGPIVGSRERLQVTIQFENRDQIKQVQIVKWLPGEPTVVNLCVKALGRPARECTGHRLMRPRADVCFCCFILLLPLAKDELCLISRFAKPRLAETSWMVTALG